MGKTRFSCVRVVVVAMVFFGGFPMVDGVASPLVSWQDWFSGAFEGQTLRSVDGWTQAVGTNSWILSDTAGYLGRGIQIDSSSQRYERTLTAVETADYTDNGFLYETKILLAASGDDRYAVTHLQVVESGGVNGFTVRFDGNSINGPSDNTIGVSTGGTSWGSVPMEYYPAAWEAGVWYTVQLRDITLYASGVSGTRTAQLTVFETDDPENILLQDVDVTAYGNDTFDKVDLLSIKESVTRTTYVDEIGLISGVSNSASATFDDIEIIEPFDADASNRCTISHGGDVSISTVYGGAHAQAESSVLQMVAVHDTDPSASAFWANIKRPVEANEYWNNADGLRLKYTADVSKELWLKLRLITPDGNFDLVVEPVQLARYEEFEDRLFPYDRFVDSEGAVLNPADVTEIRIEMAAPDDTLYFDSLSLYQKTYPNDLLIFRTSEDERNLFFPGDVITFTFAPGLISDSDISGFVYEVRNAFGDVVETQTVTLVSDQEEYVRTFVPVEVGYFEVQAFWVDWSGAVLDPRSCIATSGSIPSGLATLAVMPNSLEANTNRVQELGDQAFLGAWGFLSELAPDYQGIGLETVEFRWKTYEADGPPDRTSGTALWAESLLQEDPLPDYVWAMCHLRANLDAPAWAAKDVDDGIFPPNIEDWSGFEAYARDVIRVNMHLLPGMNPRVYVAAWEINLDSPELQLRGYAYDPDDVVELHRRIRQLIDEEDPGALLLGPSCSSPIKYYDWNEPVFTNGLLDYVDGYLCHTYHTAPPETSGLIDRLADLRALMGTCVSNGIVPSIYVNESGFRSGYGARSLHREHADWMICLSLILKGEGCKVFYPFYFVDFGPGKTWGSNFNLDSEAEYQVDYDASRSSPKPTYPALAALAKYTEGGVPDGNLRALGDSVCGYVFNRNGLPVIAIWSMEERELLLPAGDVDQVTVADLMGNESVVVPENGTVTLTLDRSPQYVLGLDPDIYIGSASVDGGGLMVIFR
jgi:hypothetical protein